MTEVDPLILLLAIFISSTITYLLTRWIEK